MNACVYESRDAKVRKRLQESEELAEKIISFYREYFFLESAAMLLMVRG